MFFYNIVPAFSWLPLTIVLVALSLFVKRRWLSGILLSLAFAIVGIIRVTQVTEDLASPSIGGIARVEQGVIVKAEMLRSELEQRLGELGMEGTSYDVAVAMTLGDKAGLDKDVKKTYSNSGASHVLALSGMHLAIIFSILAFMLVKVPLLVYCLPEMCLQRLLHYNKKRKKPVFRPRWLSGVLIMWFRYQIPVIWLKVLLVLMLLIVVWGYVVLVGMSSSVMRAGVMLSICTSAHLLWRRVPLLHSLMLAALVMLLLSPLTLFDVGFQMSFLAVLGIAVLYQPLTSLLMPRSIRSMELISFGEYHSVKEFLYLFLGKRLVQLIALTISAQIMVMPLVAHYFHQLPCYGVLTSLVVAVTAFLIIWVGILLLIMLLFVPSTATSLCDRIMVSGASCVASLLSLCVDVQNALLEMIADLPGAVVPDMQVSFPQMILIYVIIACGIRLLHLK